MSTSTLRIAAGFLLVAVATTRVAAESSICYGTTANGRLENGVQLPYEGPNFVSYSLIAQLAGRTYVHSHVREIVTSAYHALEAEHPEKVFKYAETGLRSGGPFRPHKTHQNGLSVDFIVPVVDQSGASVHLPTHPFNKFGYSIEFDRAGKYERYCIDYDAMAAHIVQIHKEATRRNFEIWRVIFDPQLQGYLFETRYAGYLKAHVRFSKKPSWVRHDAHYHVDFIIPCDVNSR